MQRVFLTFLFWNLALGACSTGFTPPQLVPPSPTEVAFALPTTAIPNPETESTALPLEPQDCGYQWANQELPELSSRLQQAIQALYPEAQARANAFGENCIRKDGSIAGFTAMETDFSVSLEVDDLANESVLGKRIVQVMQVIEEIPAEQIAGRRPGRVSIVFQSSTAQTIINFSIDQYNELPSSFNYAEIYEALKSLH